jgi:hypothetical protein
MVDTSAAIADADRPLTAMAVMIAPSSRVNAMAMNSTT